MTHPAKFLKAANDCAGPDQKFLDPAGIEHGVPHEVDIGSIPGVTSLWDCLRHYGRPQDIRQQYVVLHLGDSGAVRFKPGGGHEQFTWKLQ